MYSPHEMGQLGLFISFLSVAALATTLRFEMAIPAAEDEKNANILLLLALLFAVPVTLTGVIVMYLMIRLDWLSFGLLNAWAPLAMLPTLFSMGTFSALRYWLVRRKEFGDIGRVMALQGASRALVPVALGALRLTSVGLLVGEAVGRCVGVFAMLRRSWRSILSEVKGYPIADLRQVAARHWKFPLLLLPSSLVDLTALALPVPLIAHYYGGTQAGLFLLVQRLTFLPASLISASIADVFHSHMAECSRNSPEKMPGLLSKTTRKLALYGMAVLLPAATLSPLLFAPIFGKSWADAGLMVSIVAPWAFACIVVTPVSRTLVVAHRNDWKLIYDFTALAFILLAVIGGHAVGWSFRNALIALSVSQTLAYLVFYIILRVAAAHPSRAETVLDLI